MIHSYITGTTGINVQKQYRRKQLKYTSKPTKGKQNRKKGDNKQIITNYKNTKQTNRLVND